jgi:hypothetical protein
MANIGDISRHSSKAILAPPSAPRIFDQPERKKREKLSNLRSIVFEICLLQKW